MNELGKIAVITGATSGIGKEYAFQLAKKGYDLILVGRRVEKIKAVAEEIENNFKVKTCVEILDLTDDNKLDDFIKRLEKKDNIEFLVQDMELMIPLQGMNIVSNMIWQRFIC